jgi:hypothetical protein
MVILARRKMINLIYKDGHTDKVSLLSKSSDKEQCLMELISWYVHIGDNKSIRINGKDGNDKYIKTSELLSCNID